MLSLNSRLHSVITADNKEDSLEYFMINQHFTGFDTIQSTSNDSSSNQLISMLLYLTVVFMYHLGLYIYIYIYIYIYCYRKPINEIVHSLWKKHLKPLKHFEIFETFMNIWNFIGSWWYKNIRNGLDKAPLQMKNSSWSFGGVSNITSEGCVNYFLLINSRFMQW